MTAGLAYPAVAQTVDATTLNGKLIFGYQGWFTSQVDGDPFSNRNDTSIHWAEWGAGLPRPDNVTVDMWPDQAAYKGPVRLYPTAFAALANGSPAQVYSAWDASTVDLHFSWMRQYGLDGVALQEFVQNYIDSATTLQSEIDHVALNVRAAAEKYGRVFYVELDCSACVPGSVVTSVKSRWRHLVNQLRLTGSPAYLHDRGLPVVALFGFGVQFASGSVAGPAQAAALVKWFHDGPMQYRATVVGQTCIGWRSNGQGCEADRRWTAVYNSYDVVSPWFVGGWNDIPGADANWFNSIVGDIEQTRVRGQGYMPVLWPGFSESNLHRSRGIGGYSLNQIPRLGGLFWWHQLYNYLGRDPAHRISMGYGAMFDEVDEGTAMYKLAATASDAPNQAPAAFVTLDMPDSNAPGGYSLPTDWYLQLANCGTDALHGAFVPAAAIPLSPPGTATGCGLPDAAAAIPHVSVAGARFFDALGNRRLDIRLFPH